MEVVHLDVPPAPPPTKGQLVKLEAEKSPRFSIVEVDTSLTRKPESKVILAKFWTILLVSFPRATVLQLALQDGQLTGYLKCRTCPHMIQYGVAAGSKKQPTSITAAKMHEKESCAAVKIQRRQSAASRSLAEFGHRTPAEEKRENDRIKAARDNLTQGFITLCSTDRCPFAIVDYDGESWRLIA